MDGGAVAGRVRVSEDPIEPGRLAAEVGDPSAGAVALFLGTVRDHSEGRAGVERLEYEAYREHVERSVAEIVAEAAERWPVVRAVVEHRLGTVELGGVTVAVAVSTAHRGDAFEAARYVIDELKSRAPIWKKEHWPGGAEWVEGA